MKTTDKILFSPKEGTSGFSDEWRYVVLYSRIMDSVHKSLEWEDGEITGIQIDNLEQKIKGILKGFTITPKP